MQKKFAILSEKKLLQVSPITRQVVKSYSRCLRLNFPFQSRCGSNIKRVLTSLMSPVGSRSTTPTTSTPTPAPPTTSTTKESQTTTAAATTEEVNWGRGEKHHVKEIK